MLSRTGRAFALSAVFNMLACGCSQDGDDEPANANPPVGVPATPATVPVSDRPGSHQTMVASLRQIADASRHSHPLLGEDYLRQLRTDVGAMGPDTNPFQYVFLQSELGVQELNMDNIDAAIDHLTIAVSGFKHVNHPDPKVRERFRNRLMFKLGQAWLRLGETQNCCAHYSSDSCIIPIQGKGIHTQPMGSRKAMECFIDVLRHPTDEKVEQVQVHESARWLLNVAAMTVGEYPSAVPEEFRIPPEFFESKIEFPRFRNIYPSLGLDTNNLCGGAVVDDFTGDGFLDVLTSSYDPAEQVKFFRNNGDGSFVEQTHEVGLTGIFGGLNLVHADYDNDGDLDVYICRGAWQGNHGREPNSLLRNDGDVFTDVTFDVGLGNQAVPCKSAAWGDFDNDGDLDLYVGNESDDRISAPSQLFRNDGVEGFTDVSHTAGVGESLFVMGSVWGDYNNDRYPDLFVSVVGNTNRLYRNNGDSTFTNVADESQVERPMSSFPTWFWDANNDGNLDLFVSCSIGSSGILSLNPFGLSESSDSAAPLVHQIRQEAELELMALYIGDGKGGFQNVSRDAGLTYPALPMGANYGDLNGDGYLDFYLGTGDVGYSEVLPNVMFLNQEGESFVNVTMAGGFGHLQKGHGVSFADIDNDGDQDVYMQMGGAYACDRFNDALYENPGFGNNWLSVQLAGTTSNRCAIGARVKAVFDENGTERAVCRTISSGGSFGCNPLRCFIGIGQGESVTRLEIYWPVTDQTQVVENIAANQFVRITEGTPELETLQRTSFQFR